MMSFELTVKSLDSGAQILGTALPAICVIIHSFNQSSRALPYTSTTIICIQAPCVDTGKLPGILSNWPSCPVCMLVCTGKKRSSLDSPRCERASGRVGQCRLPALQLPL